MGKALLLWYVFSLPLLLSCCVGDENIPEMVQNGSYTGYFSPGIYNSSLNLESFNLTIGSPYAIFTDFKGNTIVFQGIFSNLDACFAGRTNSTNENLNNQTIQFIDCASNSVQFTATYQIWYGSNTMLQQGNVVYEK